jgi:hypothetical protein
MQTPLNVHSISPPIHSLLLTYSATVTGDVSKIPVNAYGYLYSSLNLSIIVVMSSCNVYVMFILIRVRYIKKLTLKEHGNIEPILYEHSKTRKKFRKQKDMIIYEKARNYGVKLSVL